MGECVIRLVISIPISPCSRHPRVNPCSHGSSREPVRNMSVVQDQFLILYQPRHRRVRCLSLDQLATLTRCRPDIFAIGFQEIVPLTAQQIVQADPEKRFVLISPCEQYVGSNILSGDYGKAKS